MTARPTLLGRVAQLIAGAGLAAAGAASPGAAASGVSAAALAEAARRTLLATLDYNETQCRPDRTFEVWLGELTGPAARATSWWGGRCRLTIKESPRDSGSRWCGGATIALARPLAPDDQVTIEIYFEEPVRGRPGKAYAFRGALRGPDGPEYTRFSSDFEAVWRWRFRMGGDPACRGRE